MEDFPPHGEWAGGGRALDEPNHSARAVSGPGRFRRSM
jgi:hypothetical protein